MLFHLVGRLGWELVHFSDKEEVKEGEVHNDQLTSVWEGLKEEVERIQCHLHIVVAGDLHRLSHLVRSMPSRKFQFLS